MTTTAMGRKDMAMMPTPLKDPGDYEPAMAFITRVDHEADRGIGNSL